MTQTSLTELLEPIMAEFGNVMGDHDKRDTNVIFCARLGLDAFEVYNCALDTYLHLADDHAPDHAIATLFLAALVLGRQLERNTA